MSRRPFLYLHIGGEKTGTSSIQRTLWKSAAQLRSHHGIIYPTAGPLADQFAHYPLISPFLHQAELDFLRADKRLDRAAVATALAAYADADENIVLSVEHLSSRLQTPERIAPLAAVLRTALPRHEPKIVFFVRNQTSLITAAWSTHVIAFGTKLPEIQTLSPLEPFYNHLLLATAWSDIFGRDAMAIRNFHTGDSVEQMLLEIGVDPGSRSLHQARAMNRSLTLEEAEIIRAINLCFGPADFEDHELVAQRQRIVRLLGRHLALRSLPKTSLGAILSPLQVRRIGELFAASNNQLQRDFDLDFNLNDYPVKPIAQCTVAAAQHPVVEREKAVWTALAAHTASGPAEDHLAADRLEARLRALSRRRIAAAIPWHPKRVLREISLLRG